METDRPKKSIYCSFICMLLVLYASSPAQETTPEVKLPVLPEEGLAGKFEIDFHYSLWSVNLIRSWFADELNARIGREIRDEVHRHLSRDYLIFNTDYEHDLVFDSEGHNYGLEFRFFPRGRGGWFSIGVSVEENRMRAVVKGTVKQDFHDGSYAEVESESYIELKPLLTNFTFRWDMVPHFPVSPYFILGFGFGAMRGEFGYTYTGDYTRYEGQIEIEGDSIKTLKEWEEEIDANLPNIFPLFHTGFGVRIQIIPLLHIKAEASFWDGFILRAGAALRF